MWWIYPVYVIDLAAMIFLSFFLGNLVDMLDKKTKISGAFIGGVLLATVTSLPELFTALSSIFLVHNASYVVGDIMGSIIFDLVVLALEVFIFVKHFHEAKFQAWHIWNGIFCTVMFLFSCYAFFGQFWGWPQIMLGDINLMSVLIFVLYVVTLIIQPKEDGEEKEEEEKIDEKWTLKRIVVLFIISSILLIATSIALTYLTDLIKHEIPALSGSVAGAILLGIGTSIPEIISTVQLFRKKNYDAGFGNMIGSCTFDFGILALADFLSWHQIHPDLNVSIAGIFTLEQIEGVAPTFLNNDFLQFGFFGLVVSALTVLFCLLRVKTNLFSEKKILGYVITGAYATICLAAYLLIFILV